MFPECLKRCEDDPAGNSNSHVAAALGEIGSEMDGEGGGLSFIDAQHYDKLTVGGRTISRADSERQLRGGNHTYHIQMNINMPDADSFRKSRGQIMQHSQRLIRRR